jgi:PAS domain S-box-containing protein
VESLLRTDLVQPTAEATSAGASNDPARLAALRSYRILDTDPEQAFDDLVELAAAVCDTPMATIALVDENRAWFKARRGLAFAEVPLDFSLAREAILHDDLFVVADLDSADHLLSPTVAAAGVRFFAGAPLVTAEGYRLGAICVSDTRPRELSPVQRDALRAIARQTMTQLELRRVAHAEDSARLRFRILMEQLPGATYLEPLGASSASYMSPQIESLTGYTPEEWISETDFFARVLHPDDRERVLADFAAANDAHGVIQAEYRIVRKDGRIVWIHDDASVARAADGRALHLQGYLADITARKESELELHKAEERYRALAEQLPLVTYIDHAVPGGPAHYISPQIEELLGYPPEAWLAGRELFISSLHPDDRVAVLEQMHNCRLESKKLEAEYRMVRRDGRVIYVRDTAVPILDAAGEMLHWQGYVVDITERRAIEAQRDGLLESERAQNEQLRELDHLKDEFIAAVSHELRTPLTSILGYLELALDDVDAIPPEHQNFLAVIERNAVRLRQLVGDLLFVAQAEAGHLALEWSEVELETLIAQCVEANQPAAKQGGVALVANCARIAAVSGDPVRLTQVLDNLISNAIKFSPGGGRVTVRLTRKADVAVLEVEDTGTGIPAAEVGHVFDRFFRARGAAEKAIQGTGLGLSIAQAIAEAHGGSISVESAVGVGTTFRLELPLAQGEDELRAAA